MARSPEFEQAFLDEACRGAGLVAIGLTEMAQARLEQGEREYEDRSLALPLEELAAQIEEEAIDVACWSVLMAESDAAGQLDDDTRWQLSLLLQSLTSTAAQQALLVREIRNTLNR